MVWDRILLHWSWQRVCIRESKAILYTIQYFKLTTSIHQHIFMCIMKIEAGHTCSEIVTPWQSSQSGQGVLYTPTPWIHGCRIISWTSSSQLHWTPHSSCSPAICCWRLLTSTNTTPTPFLCSCQQSRRKYKRIIEQKIHPVPQILHIHRISQVAGIPGSFQLNAHVKAESVTADCSWVCPVLHWISLRMFSASMDNVFQCLNTHTGKENISLDLTGNSCVLARGHVFSS